MSQSKYTGALALASKAARKLRAKEPVFVERDLIQSARRQPHLAHALMRIGAHMISNQTRT
ncbi:MAG: hypothetical protein QM488_12800 [Rhizobiaceae bacterium]